MSKEIDFGRIQMLLDIMQKVSTTTPQHTYLSSAAGNELKEINDAIGKEARERNVTKEQERITAKQLEDHNEIMEAEKKDEEERRQQSLFSQQEPGAAAQQQSPVRRAPVIRRELAQGEHMTEATTNG